MVDVNWRCDDSAIVESGAVIGDETVIWHHTHVRAGAFIGRGCTLGKNVYVDVGVTIGDNVKIQNNVSLYSGVTIADDVFLGPSCVFTNDLRPRAFSVAWVETPTMVERGATIGANATIVCGATIGSWAMVGAGAVVTRDVQQQQLVIGNPARPAGWVCVCGELVSRQTKRPSAHLECERCAAK